MVLKFRQATSSEPIRPQRHPCIPLGLRFRLCIDHRGLLADEELARAVEHQAALLLGRLGLDKPHVGPCDRFADSLGVTASFYCRLRKALRRPAASGARLPRQPRAPEIPTWRY